jgi:hypothetical protein
MRVRYLRVSVPICKIAIPICDRCYVYCVFGSTKELLGSLRIVSLSMLLLAQIIKLVKNNELKSVLGSIRYVLMSTHELLVNGC